MINKIKKIAIVGAMLILGSVFFAFKTNYFEVAKQLEIYSTLFKELNMYYIDEINPAKLTDTAIKNMLKDLDPYTNYYDEQGVEEVKINSSGEYSGIGAQSVFINKKLLIVEVYEGYSADKTGIKVGDEITKIDDVLIEDFQNNQVASLLKGSVNSSVQLTVKRQDKTFDVSVTREKITLNPVPHYQMITDEIGYIAFNKFNSKASKSVKNAFVDLKSKGMNKLILDLRGNPGGLLNQAIRITNLFVPKNEVVVTTKAKIKKWSEVYKTKKEPIDLEIPIVILINGKSASAAEIVAGSLQDLDRAVILGQRSFGKGLVQRYRNLTYGTKLKLTISKYYTPSGRNIQELDYTNRKGDDIPKFSNLNREAFKTKNKRIVYGGGGIAPDVEVKLTKETDATKALYKSDAIFNFATDYYFKNPSIAKPENYVFSDDDYQGFISFLIQDKNNFKTNSEKNFMKAYETSEKENLAKGISVTYKKLLSQLENQKLEELNRNKEEIKARISDEIINRYYFKKGEYQNHIVFNKSIQEAIKVLQNDNRYYQILVNESN
ncbi:MAG: S41 family peptidase [Flavobacteriaceae bacterium]|nr:S41 family peptidase [Flavobacteriaceae bacterium]